MALKLSLIVFGHWHRGASVFAFSMLYYFKDSRLAGSVLIHEILLVVIVLLRIAQQTDCGNLKAWQEAASQVSKTLGQLMATN